MAKQLFKLTLMEEDGSLPEGTSWWSEDINILKSSVIVTHNKPVHFKEYKAGEILAFVDNTLSYKIETISYCLMTKPDHL